MPDPVETRCQATTRTGAQCKNEALNGTAYCYVHQPLDGIMAAEANPAGPPLPEDDEEARRQLAEELERLIAELQAQEPAFRPSPFSPQALLAALQQNLSGLPPAVRLDVLYRLREAVQADSFDVTAWQGAWFLMNYWKQFQQRAQRSPLAGQFGGALAQALQKLQQTFGEESLDVDTLKGVWFMASYSVQYQLDVLKRRVTGEYMTDEFGLDWEFLDAIRPLLSFLYKFYWRVQTSGLEHVPDNGRALLVLNHSGQLPVEAAMVMAAVMFDHPAQRLVRNLYDESLPAVPFLSSALEKIGQALATTENGTRLLQQDELVGVFPEGYVGTDRAPRRPYQLGDFGRGDFVRMALQTGAPLIPVAIVGAEESYFTLRQAQKLAGLGDVPLLPLSMRFPWLELLGVVPLPARWSIDFGEPVPTADLRPEAAGDAALVSQLRDQVRTAIQQLIDERLAQRHNVFLG